MTTQDYAKRHGVTEQAALKHFSRGTWTDRDGTCWRAEKRGKQWDVEIVANGGDAGAVGGINTAALRARKTVEEIRMLQNRNEKIWQTRFAAWNDCVLRALSECCGDFAARVTALRIDPETARQVETAFRDAMGRANEKAQEELTAYWDSERERIR